MESDNFKFVPYIRNIYGNQDLWKAKSIKVEGVLQFV